jgi:capsular exopolysaccharide synthesis family protein
LLLSGPLPPNPGELLGSEAMKERVEQLESLADLIVFDSPSVLGVADPTILATLANGILLVVAAGKTKREFVSRAKARLEQVGSPIFGVVLNMVAPTRQRAFDYYRRGTTAARKRLSLPGWGRQRLSSGPRGSSS